MKKFFQSGTAFLVIALLFFLTALVGDKAAVFVCLGSFWMILGIVTRAKYGKPSPAAKESKP
jgi:hypothetical protein